MQASQLPFAAPPEWKGTERYSVLRRVGEGGMGVVYEALDRDGGRGVALKTLLRVDPNSLYLFKQEFRTLADVHHRNLVHLYELVQPEDGPLFFAMELVEGANFIEYAHHVPRVRGPRDDSSSTLRPGTANQVTRQGGPRSVPMSIGPPALLGDEPTRADSARLRPALRQLVMGLGALHAAGKLHRDIKPSNVLVTDEGRVVILDFGIALELSRAAGGDQRDGDVVGTPKYMAPEQAAGEVPTPASDWYAVGVMLYETLAGRLPFEGPSLDVLRRKMTEEPLPPSTWARGIPPDLEALCVALLQQQPSGRPDGAEILRRLGAVGSTSGRSQPLGAAEAHPGLLVGREEQLRVMREALDLVTAGQSVTLRISGGAGMGKSTLVQHFLDELEAGGAVVMLCGRAYERESVPYKAVDSLIDSLATLLCRIEEAEGPFSTPRHAAALAHLFPVLRRVSSFAGLPAQAVDDAGDVRHSAFGALRDLLGSLARRRPLVLYIDDVQWGDVDSVALLQEVIRPPNAPPLLLLLTYREEDAATSPFLIEMNDRWPTTIDVRDVVVGRLDLHDAQRLALKRMDLSDDSFAMRTARAVAREARGSPFLIEELVRSNRAQSTQTGATLGVLTLAAIVGERLARLPRGARCLAEVVAVGGRPLAFSTLADACGEVSITDDDVEILRSERIVRAGFRDGREVIEPCHDRIRETIVDQLPADVLRTHHGGLARALEAASGADMEAIAVHLLGSGETERGARYAERAGEQAAAKLAFEQAARLYRLALETLPRPPDEERPVRVRLAAALEQAGRGAEAARVYLEAAEDAPPLERVDLERAASQQLLFSGRTDEGTALLRRVLAAVGMRVPRTPLGAILSLLFHRLVLRIRGLEFKERSPEEVSLEDRVRVEALFTVAVGFSVVDVVLGACMQARFLRLALDVGSRMHVLQATSVQITHLATQGGPIGKAERGAYAISERLSQTIQHPDAEAYFAVCRGLSLFHRGRWKEAREAFFSRAAERSNLAFSHARLFGVYSLFYLGKLREHARRAARLLADSERRGDLYTAVNLYAAPIVDDCLAADDPDAAREHLRRVLATWTQNGFHIQHWKAMVRGAEIELYVGDGAAAYARLERDRRAYRRSLLDHSQFVREMTRYTRGCAAVASALDAPPDVRRARLAEARTAARRLERQRMTWAAPLASLLLAAAANAAGDTATATIALRTAIERAEAADMGLHAAAARHQLGCLLGGDEGAELRRQGEGAMAAEGVRVPARMAAMILPGRWGY